MTPTPSVLLIRHPRWQVLGIDPAYNFLGHGHPSPSRRQPWRGDHKLLDEEEQDEVGSIPGVAEA